MYRLPIFPNSLKHTPMQSILVAAIEENPMEITPKPMKYPLPTIEIKHHACYCEWMTHAEFHFCFFHKQTKRCRKKYIYMNTQQIRRGVVLLRKKKRAAGYITDAPLRTPSESPPHHHHHPLSPKQTPNFLIFTY